MQSFALLNDASGFYVLSAEGQLGTIGADGRFVMDVERTKRFFDYLAGYVRHYTANPQAHGFRLAIIFRAEPPRRWGAETMLLERQIVHDLYPISGPAASQLTNFQKQNAEKSLYRGMELLLEYRSEQASELPVFCPVLFDRGTQLANYPGKPVQPPSEAEAAGPVLEVLNLLAGIPVTRRAIPEIRNLMDDVHARLIRKDARRSQNYTVLDKAFERTTDENETVDDPFDDRERGDSSEFEISGAIGEALDRWLGKPHKFLKPDDFRFFHMFRELGPDQLEMLTKECPAYYAPAGAPLLGRGTTDTWNFFLLSGRVELDAVDGAKKVIVAGSDTTRSPVCHLKPRMYGVRALTPVEFLWIESGYINKVLGR
jgi:hypothetical protein